MINYFNLQKQYEFYHKFHKNHINQFIHILCIPIILWTFAVFFSYIDFNYSSIILCPFFGFINLNGTSIILTIYSLYYFILEPRLGMIMYCILYFMQITSYYFYLYISYAWYYALVIHIISWILQLLGHYIFEKNKPALISGLVQSFLIAPLFVLLEIMFMFGYFLNYKKTNTHPSKYI